jgi:hypothetical protein
VRGSHESVEVADSRGHGERRRGRYPSLRTTAHVSSLVILNKGGRSAGGSRARGYTEEMSGPGLFMRRSYSGGRRGYICDRILAEMLADIPDWLTTPGAWLPTNFRGRHGGRTAALRGQYRARQGSRRGSATPSILARSERRSDALSFAGQPWV